MKFYNKKSFGLSSISKYNVSSNDIFEELDIKIHNSHLVHAFLYEIAQLPLDKSLTFSYIYSSLHSSCIHHTHIHIHTEMDTID